MAPRSEAEREVVSALLETKAVDFQAIGEAVAKFGPTAPFALDYEEVFCGTMRNFVRVFHVVGPPTPLGELQQLRQLGGELNR